MKIVINKVETKEKEKETPIQLVIDSDVIDHIKNWVSVNFGKNIIVDEKDIFMAIELIFKFLPSKRVEHLTMEDNPDNECLIDEILNLFADLIG